MGWWLGGVPWVRLGRWAGPGQRGFFQRGLGRDFSLLIGRI